MGATSLPSRLPVREFVAVSLLGFLALVCGLFVANDGGARGALAAGVAASSVFGVAAQLVLFAWLSAGVLFGWELAGVTPAVLHARSPRRCSAPDAALVAGAATALLAAGLGLYATLCWREATGGATQCAVTRSPVPVEFLVLAALAALLATPAPLPVPAARFGALRCLAESLSAVVGWPALSGNVAFEHVLVTDALTSAGLLLGQLEYVACLFVSSDWLRGAGQAGQGAQCSGRSADNLYVRPLVLVLPFWLRLSQCLFLYRRTHALNHAANAVKYCTCLAVVATSAVMQVYGKGTAGYHAWRHAWLASLVVKTAYCYWWDLRMDWGLLAGGGHPLLRERLVYGHPGLYYFAMLSNLAGRISWSIGLSPHICGADCRLMISWMEALRRAQWALLRAEHQLIAVGPVGEAGGPGGELLLADVPSDGDDAVDEGERADDDKRPTPPA